MGRKVTSLSIGEFDGMFGDGFCLENACELRRTSFFTRNTFHTNGFAVSDMCVLCFIKLYVVQSY